MLTLSRELGAGDTGFAPTLGTHLGLARYDRELLEQQALRLGVAETELEQIDEHPASIFQRFRPGSLYQRYFEAMGQLMNELAALATCCSLAEGEPVSSRQAGCVPRPPGGRDGRPPAAGDGAPLAAGTPGARADRPERLRAEELHGKLFGHDWSNPLEYQLTVNSARLGPAAVDLVAFAAERHWARAQ